MGDKDRIELTITIVPYGDLTRKPNLLETISKTRVSWTQRGLSWFRETTGRSRIVRAGAVSAAMLALISCSTSSPIRQLTYDIPCQYADALPDIKNNGIWLCDRLINRCSCVPVSAQSIFGR